MSDRAKRRALKRLQEIYASLPEVHCKRLCQQFCGPVTWTAIEQINIGETRQIKNWARPQCPYLEEGMCSIYERRPLICRLWGAMQILACPHGCLPDRWISQEEANRLQDEVAGLWKSITNMKFPYACFGRNKVSAEDARIAVRSGFVFGGKLPGH